MLWICVGILGVTVFIQICSLDRLDDKVAALRDQLRSQLDQTKDMRFKMVRLSDDVRALTRRLNDLEAMPFLETIQPDVTTRKEDTDDNF